MVITTFLEFRYSSYVAMVLGHHSGDSIRIRYSSYRAMYIKHRSMKSSHSGDIDFKRYVHILKTNCC